ncbi:MAG: heat-inducible transcriptional repressor HrcA [Symbiobacteriaceae bacterium]|nr:heat-inducible transcriptional repressor HrcA [Symbiobacteriaceae bacterium]
MNARKGRILLAIVQDYIHGAEPVGSRTIARRYLSQLSAATIRNEMADLEEMGFLEQPHTSAGRIPSDKGYRFYVNYLLNDQEALDDDHWEQARSQAKLEIATLRQRYTTGVKAVEAIVQETSQMLSSLTSYIALISAPGSQQSSFYRLQLVEMGAGQAVAVLVSDHGHVANRIIPIPQGANQRWLNEVSEYLSSTLQGRTLQQLATEGMRELRRELAGRRHDYDLFFDTLLKMLREAAPGRLFLGSTTQIMTLPEFQDLERMRSLLSFIETDQHLQQLLSPGEEEARELLVRIGAENSLTEVGNLSLVSAPYQQHGRLLGYLGILGPTRMDYARVLAIVLEMSVLLNETMERLD